MGAPPNGASRSCAETPPSVAEEARKSAYILIMAKTSSRQNADRRVATQKKREKVERRSDERFTDSYFIRSRTVCQRKIYYETVQTKKLCKGADIGGRGWISGVGKMGLSAALRGINGADKWENARSLRIARGNFRKNKKNRGIERFELDKMTFFVILSNCRREPPANGVGMSRNGAIRRDFESKNDRNEGFCRKRKDFC